MAGFGGWGAGAGRGGGGMGGGGAGGLRRAVDGWSDEELGKAYDHHVVVRLAGYVKPYRARVTVAVIGTVLFALSSFTLPALVGMAIDRALAGEARALAVI